jgi:UDP-N-acetylglucosamine acyltransferase
VKIHPTAIIEQGAQLGANVEIGPYSIIGPKVVIGDETTVQSHVVIEGDVRIGRKNLIGHGSIIGTPPQDLAFTPERKTWVEIGDENVIREHCTIHRGSPDGTATRIGHKNLFMVGVHIGHNCEIADNVIVANNCLLAGHVRVDNNAFLGGGSVFHQNMHIGRLVMVQGASAFGKDLPPFVLAAERNYVFGLNVIGLRRAGFSAKERDDIKAAFRLIYHSGLNVGQAIEASTKMDLGKLGREFVDFVANAKKRGICPLKRQESSAL